MKVCPGCGEVYPDRTTSCPLDGARLVSWGSASSDVDLGRYTDVDPPSFRFGGPILEQARTVAGEVGVDTPSGRRSGDTTSDTSLARISRATARMSPLSNGRVLAARYRLGRPLGIGGYGAVFAAEDLHDGVPVAIKILSPAVESSAELVTRFHREAIAASRIRHPSIVEVVDFDVDDDGAQFIVMEYLDGRDLADWLEEVRRLPPGRALAIAAQCARGLAAAHQAGVLHRDLKPANVFLVRHPDGSERVKVIDFGISKLTRVAGDYTDLTGASKVVGTPQYMPPEQARGEDLDGRADVYALGVMLFEMLTGERPFTGRSPLELFAQHVRAPRRPPSALVPALAACPGLDAVVVGALASERSQRFPSMAAFANALMTCLRAIEPDAADELAECSGEITAASAPPAPPPAWPGARYLAAIAGIALVAGLAVALTTGSSPAPVPAAPPPPVAPHEASAVAPAPAPAPSPIVPAPSPIAPAPSPPPDAGVVAAPAPPPPPVLDREPVLDRAPAPGRAPAPRASGVRAPRPAAARLGVAEW